LCRESESCLDAADRRKAFARALRTTVTTDAVAGLRSHLVARGRIEENR
jgi:hypothetical protein